MQIAENASLKSLNTFDVPARARWLVQTADVRKIPGVLDDPQWSALPALVLGEGSNILFTKDYAGLVLKLTGSEVRILEENGTHAVVEADAGHSWHDFVLWTLQRGLQGLENLALIPGTVGAAPVQNIGAYGVELAGFIEHIEAYDRIAAKFVRLGRMDCRFSYRHSLFKDTARYVIVAVAFKLSRQARLVLDYPGIQQELDAAGAQDPKPLDVADAVCRLRRKKLPDPKAVGNAGSFFKNPIIGKPLLDRLLAQFPNMPFFMYDDHSVKLSAAWLIESLGYKGLRRGEAGVSERHALVLINYGEATGLEIKALAEEIIAAARSRFDLALDPEPTIL